MLRYKVLVYTGGLLGSDTEANVFICIYGEKGDSGRRPLHRSLNHETKFQESQVRHSVVDQAYWGHCHCVCNTFARFASLSPKIFINCMLDIQPNVTAKLCSRFWFMFLFFTTWQSSCVAFLSLCWKKSYFTKGRCKHGSNLTELIRFVQMYWWCYFKRNLNLAFLHFDRCTCPNHLSHLILTLLCLAWHFRSRSGSPRRTVKNWHWSWRCRTR